MDFINTLVEMKKSGIMDSKIKELQMDGEFIGFFVELGRNEETETCENGVVIRGCEANKE